MRLEKHGQAISSITDWQRLAGPKSDGQWCEGRSAYECASAWCAGATIAIPEELRSLLDSHPVTRGCELISGVPEHQVRFDSLPGEPRNADLVLLATSAAGRVAISIEAKADEPFGEYVGEILADAVDRVAHGESTGVIQRLQGLASMLPPRAPRSEKFGSVRYQLLTAVAGALSYARVHQAIAVLIVHEFQTSRTTTTRIKANGRDLDVFIRRLSGGALKHVVAGELYGPLSVPGYDGTNGTQLYVGKAVRHVQAKS